MADENQQNENETAGEVEEAVVEVEAVVEEA